MKHNFEPIQNPLEHILKKFNLNEALEINIMFDQWEQVVGKTLARISKPLEYDSDTRTIRISASSEAWKKELMEKKSILIKKMHQKFKTLNVEKIDFV